MKFIECTQGSPEWLQARSGAITASCFAEAISVLQRDSAKRKKGEPTAAAEKYAGDLAIERISGKPYGEPPKAWVLERGHIMEEHARRAYETRMGLLAMEAGVCKTDDDWFGYSTDGLVDSDGLIEIKCPIASDKIIDMLTTGDTSEYDDQMQGGMWITGRKWCDFIMYVPDLASVGRDLFVKRVHRDDDYINTMEEKLLAFRTRVIATEDFFRTGTVQAIPAQTVTETVSAISTILTLDEMVSATAPAAVVAALTPAPAANVVPMRAATPAPVTAASTPPTLKLGAIADRLGFTLTADFLKSLGFEPAATDRASKLYHEASFPLICMRLIAHIQNAQAQQAT